jgi:hypothetical protein
MNGINIPTFLELEYANSSKIFEAEEILASKVTPDQLQQAEALYESVIERLEAGEDLEEGFFGGLIGGAVGALAGPAIGRAICKVLGIDTKGTLGKLFTSRLVTTAMGVALGK